jgi:ATP-dependent Clp protease ATP-binding subunit ClpB
MSSISKPVELEKLEKELRTFEIELEAKKAEKDTSPENIKKIEKEIANKKEAIQSIAATWKKEKSMIDEMKNLREQIDTLKSQANIGEREGNL